MPRQQTTLLCAALALAAASAALWALPGDATPTAPPAPPAVDPTIADQPSTPSATGTPANSVPPPTAVAPPVPLVDDGARARVDTRGWTSGVVKGDIQLAVSVLDRIQSVRVEIEESRNRTPGGPAPFRRVEPLTLGRGTPTFEIRDIPFSAYPYVVTVLSPGLNGSRCTLAIDERTPLVDDVLLRITPGAPLTILLRDQDATPLQGVDVHAMPVGEPHGRTAHRGVSDNFGSVVFLDVLAGDYEVQCSQAGQLLVPPHTLGVQPGVNAAAQANVRGQGHTITIERGVPVTLLVADGAGYPIVDAAVVATATDRIKLTEIPTTTDAVGRASFARLQPGLWSFSIQTDRYENWQRQLTLKPDQEPLHLDVRLVPRRL
jgi:hypothetical protein